MKRITFLKPLGSRFNIDDEIQLIENARCVHYVDEYRPKKYKECIFYIKEETLNGTIKVE